MKDAPAFDLYTQRWLAGTASMTAEERGAYIQLLCEQWEQDGLPDDLRRLAAVARCRPAVLPSILEKFPVFEDGKRRNQRLEVIRGEQRARIEKSRVKIEKMNAARAACRGSTRGSTSDSCRPPSPLTTHPVLLEKEPKAVFGEDVLAVVALHPKNGNRYEAAAALLRHVQDGENLGFIRECVKLHAAAYANLSKLGQQKCPGPMLYFEQARWRDDPAGFPWVYADESKNGPAKDHYYMAE